MNKTLASFALPIGYKDLDRDTYFFTVVDHEFRAVGCSVPESQYKVCILHFFRPCLHIRIAPLTEQAEAAAADTPEDVKAAVQRGLGVAVISALAVQEELAAGKLLSFDLDRSGVFRRIYLAWPAGCPLTAAERRFADYVLSHAESE